MIYKILFYDTSILLYVITIILLNNSYWRSIFSCLHSALKSEKVQFCGKVTLITLKTEIDVLNLKTPYKN